MKKKILIILGILIVIALATIGVIVIRENSKYTLDETKELIRKSLDLPENVYLKTEYFDENGKLIGVIENSITENYGYVKQGTTDTVNFESYSDYVENRLVTIMHSDKLIYITENYPKQEITEEINEFFVSVKRNEQYAHLGIYEYLGREKVNGRECIKVSLTDNNKDGVDITNYYIDIEKGYTLKQENIDDGKVSSYLINEYKENVVKDDEIKYNAEKYVDYKIVSEE